jgi:hypothetical protein
MSSGPSYDPVIQQLQLLLTGYGYNFYNSVNQARADDLLVRERAAITWHRQWICWPYFVVSICVALFHR